MKRATSTLAWFLTALLLVTATACSGSAEGAGSGEGGVLKLQDPGNAGPLAYAKKHGILEKRLAKVGAKVEWGGTYASFTATIDAVRSGSVNVLGGAVSPALGYLANSDDIKIFSFTDPVTDKSAPPTDGLVVPRQSGIRSVRDLVGKRVAVNKGGKGEYLLLRALERANIPVGAVERVYLNPDQAGSAFATGKVDAWWAIVDAYPEAVSKGAHVLVNGADVDDKDADIVAARTELVKQHPQALKVYLQVLRELTAEQKKSPAKFQNVFTDKGPTAAHGHRLADDIAVARHENVPRYATTADGRYITAVAGVFRKYGVVKTRIDPAKVIADVSRKP